LLADALVANELAEVNNELAEVYKNIISLRFADADILNELAEVNNTSTLPLNVLVVVVILADNEFEAAFIAPLIEAVKLLYPIDCDKCTCVDTPLYSP
jgi:hypothetical protein